MPTRPSSLTIALPSGGSTYGLLLARPEAKPPTASSKAQAGHEPLPGVLRIMLVG